MKFYFGRGSVLPRLAHAEGEGGGQGNNDGGGNETPWTDNIPEGVRDWDEVKNSDSPEKFWDQMINMRSRMGSSIRIPGADAGEEDMTKFHAKLADKVPGLMTTPDFENDETMQDLYTRMGRPETPADYKTPEFKDDKGQPIQGLDLSRVEAFKEIAYKNGLSGKKYQDIMIAITNVDIAQHQVMVENQQKDQDALSTEWGEAFKRNSDIISNFISKTNAPESVVNAAKSGLLDSASMKWIHGLATQAVGSKREFQTDYTNDNVMTPDEAALKISEIRNNQKHPYHSKMDPGHKAAMKTMRELYLLKNPKTGKDAAPGTTFRIGGGDG